MSGFVHIIRHGEPQSGWGQSDAEPDPGLTDTGRAQARAAAEHLAALPQGRRPRRILCSPLRRCRETAAALADLAGLAVTAEPGVAEIPTPPHLSGAARAPWLRQAFEGDWAAIEGIDGEAWRASVVAALVRADGAAVFSHFVATNAAVSAAEGSDAVVACRPAPGSVTTFRIEGGRLVLERLGEELQAEGRVL